MAAREKLAKKTGAKRDFCSTLGNSPKMESKKERAWNSKTADSLNDMKRCGSLEMVAISRYRIPGTLDYLTIEAMPLGVPRIALRSTV